MEARNQQTTDLKKAELRARVEAKRKELEGEFARLKAEGYAASSEAVQRTEKKLNEIRSELADDWDRLSEQAAARLNRWLK